MSAATSSSEQPCVRVIDWNAYYSECHKFTLYQSQKFSNLLSQSSVFALAVCTAIVTMAEKLHVGYPENLFVACSAIVGLTAYGTMIVVSFLQTRVAGTEMARVETEVFGLRVGLLSGMRASSAAFFGRTWTLVLVIIYLGALMALILTAALLSNISGGH